MLTTQSIASNQNGVTLTFDSWTNVKKENILGVVLMTHRGDTLIWDAIDCSEQRIRTSDVVSKIQVILKSTEEKAKVIAVVSDSAASYASARRHMQDVRPDIIWIPCFSHQINLYVADVLRSVPIFQSTIKNASTLVECFNRSTQLTAALRDKQIDMYGKQISLKSATATRWDSNSDMILSLMSSSGALRSLSIELSGYNPDKPEIRSGIRDIINNGNFWESLEILYEYLSPLTAALDILQSNTCRIDKVGLIFGYIVQKFNTENLNSVSEKYVTHNQKNEIVNRFEKRWKSWDQPLIILAIALNPVHRRNRFSKISKITKLLLSEWASFYLQSWFHEENTSLTAEMLRYLDIEGEFGSSVSFSLTKDGTNPFCYWNLFEEDAPQLSKVAKRIFSVSISTAVCERLFRNFGQIHSKERNRLDFQKTLKVAQLRWKIRHDQSATSKRKKIKVSENLTNTQYQNQKNFDSQDQKNTESSDQSNLNHTIISDYDCSDDEDMDCNVFEWEALINEWLSQLDEELFCEENTFDDTNNMAQFQNTRKFKCQLQNLFEGDLKSILQPTRENKIVF